MKTVREIEMCPVCGLNRMGRYMWCPKCGHHYEKEIPLKNHSATYDKCKDCKWFVYGSDSWSSSIYGTCTCTTKKPKKLRGYKGTSYIHEERAGSRAHTTKACSQFERKV